MGNTSEAPNSIQKETKEQALLSPGKEPQLLPPPAEPVRPKRRRCMWWAGAAVVFLLLYLLFHSSKPAAPAGKAGAKQPAGASITVGQSTTGDMNIYVTALGTVTPTYTVTLYSQITGQINTVHYREGQMVNKGDALVDIDPRPYQSMLTQAEGTLERDQGLLAEARMDLQRYQTAAAKNAIPRQQLEDQEKLVMQDEGTVKADQGTVDYDTVQLSYCHIVSPITGRVGLRLVDPGNTIFSGSSSTLAVITQLQPITVVFNVSEDDLPQVQSQLRGGRALEVDAYDRANEKQIEAGKLTSLDNEVDTSTGTVKFRAEFANKNLSLFPNQFVNARLLVNTLRKVTLVPTAAVQHNGTNAFVYIVDQSDKVTVQQVTALNTNDEQTAVEGLNAGVTVATSGFDRLENGVQVTVRGQRNQQNNSAQPPQSNPNPKSGSGSQKSQGGSGSK
jgi:multidrug efflux system membrane fusion protein